MLFKQKYQEYRESICSCKDKSVVHEKPQTLKDLFVTCNSIEYIHIDEQSADYAYRIIDGTLYLYFQPSSGKTDWKNNFFFFATPYKEMGTRWYAHRGFLRVWKVIEPHVKELFDQYYQKEFDHIVIVGYSHGGAIATLAHEWVWFNYPEIRDKMVGYGFGAPRVYFYWFAHMRKDLKERWETFYPVRNSTDLVTHVPFNFMFFRHVNKVLKMNTALTMPIKSHYPGNYEASLQKLDERANYEHSFRV